jgi:hypothetical protein
LPGLALNHDPPNLALLSSWDYRFEPLCLPSQLYNFLILIFLHNFYVSYVTVGLYSLNFQHIELTHSFSTCRILSYCFKGHFLVINCISIIWAKQNEWNNKSHLKYLCETWTLGHLIYCERLWSEFFSWVWAYLFCSVKGPHKFKRQLKVGPTLSILQCIHLFTANKDSSQGP